MRKYQNTLFDAETFARLWEQDPAGVRAEAKARGSESKLSAKVKAQKVNTRPQAAKVTTPATPARKPGRPATPAENLTLDGLVKRLAAQMANAEPEGWSWSNYRTHKARIAEASLSFKADVARRMLLDALVK